MTTWGWVMLVVSCGSVTGLVVWCFWRVLWSSAARTDMHAPLDIETHEPD